MTNAEKFLKVETNIDEFTLKFDDWHFKNSDVIGYGEALFRFLQAEEKPTLTEDEKVILRNLDKKYKYISRNCDTELYLKNEADDNCRYVFRGFNHLFKFIKARRRI